MSRPTIHPIVVPSNLTNDRKDRTMPNDRPTHDSDWWSFVQAHELDPTDEPTYNTFSGPSGAGVKIHLSDGTTIEVTLDRYRDNNGYPTLVTVTPANDRHQTPYRKA